MTTQLKIEGMSCGHCVAAVKSALEGVEGVDLATVNLVTGSATVTHADSANVSEMTTAVEEEGYQVTSTSIVNSPDGE
jgi:copper chaperone CopZ